MLSQKEEPKKLWRLKTRGKRCKVNITLKKFGGGKRLSGSE